jgi:hypothetical protein
MHFVPVAFILLAAVLPRPLAPVDADPASPVVVPFRELVRGSERWLGETVETVVQVQSAFAEPWEGYLSGLSPATHVALDVWADEQLLWVADEHARPAGRLYVTPTVLLGGIVASCSAPEGTPRTWARYTRLRVRVRVAAYTAGRGWLEVTAAAPTAEQVPEGTLLHAIRGFELLGQKAHGLAVNELERALRAPLPEHASRPLEAALAKARRGATASSAPR